MLDNKSNDQVIFLDRPLVRASDYNISLNRPYIVKNLLLASQVSLLAGPPNNGKSSVLACIAAHVALGKNLGEMRTRRAAVLYVAAEDPMGIAERAYGFWQNADTELAEFHIHDSAVNLTDDSEMKKFRSEAETFRSGVNAQNLLIVFDTLNLCIGDGDENSARDMSRVIRNAHLLAHETSAHVMIIHHTGVSDASRPRGSSSMLGNVDTTLILRRLEEPSGRKIVQVDQLKQRSVQVGKPLFFEISPYEIGRDQDGDLVTVPIAKLYTPSGHPLQQPSVTQAKNKEADKRMDGIRQIIQALDAKRPGRSFGPRDIYDHVDSLFGNQKPDSMQKAVRRALAGFAEDRFLDVTDDGNYKMRRPEVHTEDAA